MTNNGPQEVPTLQCTSLSCKEGSVASAPVLLGLAVQVIACGKIRYGTAMNMSMKLCVVTSDGRSCRENEETIGRIFAASNWAALNHYNVHTFSQSLRQRVFENHHPAINQPGNDFELAIHRGVVQGKMKWALMDKTHKGHYIGYLCTCPCGAQMRTAWNPRFSSKIHMEKQRQILMHWLNLEWQPEHEPEHEPLPIV